MKITCHELIGQFLIINRIGLFFNKIYMKKYNKFKDFIYEYRWVS